MRNLNELSVNELGKCISLMAVPAEKIFKDKAFTSALDEYRANVTDKTTVAEGLSLFAVKLFPLLVNGKHEKDVYMILAAIDGVSIDVIKAKSGAEIMQDMFRAFVLDGDVAAIFRPMCEAWSE